MERARRAAPCLLALLLAPGLALGAVDTPAEKVVDALRGLVREYNEYVADGQVVDQQGYDDNVIGAYLPYLHDAWAEARPLVAEEDAANAESMDADVARIDERVRAVAPNAEIEALALDLEAEVEAALGDVAPPAGSDPASGLRAAEQRVDEAVAAYASGERDHALELLSSAYLELYAPQAEAAVPRAQNARIEQLMNIALRDRMQRGAPLAEVQATQRELHAAFADAAAALAAPRTDAGLFANSALIIAREGFEAALVLAAVIGYLVRSGHKDKVRQIYLGAGLALAGSLLLFALVSTVLTVSGASRELLEGVTALLAVVVLFYVSYWLIDKVQIKRWNRFIQGKVRSALTGGRASALVSVAFLAVFREGA
ncbi:MAG TPA: FTR1 family protein, partial [Candidatus Thermoplasmatota archaeon]|nr:FTR1 family protein [Candidatus Thermoplasmatota archaeon]